MTYRKRASLSQEELALLASLTYGAIGNYERGTSRPGNRDIAMSLVRALVKQGGIEQADEANALLVSEGYAALSTEEVKTIWGNTNKGGNKTLETVLPSHQHRVDTNRFEGLESYFTDREDIQNYFIETLESSKVAKRVLVIHGIGGIGKSSLLGIFQRYCQEHGLPVGLVSADSVHTAVDVLLGWNNDLASTVKLQSFQEAYSTYWQIQMTVSERLQGVGGENQRDESGFGMTGNWGQNSWLRTFLTPSQAQWFLDSTALLTNAFLADLKRVASTHRIVLMIDTYEQVRNLDDWICDVVRLLPGNVLIVIAGRETVDWHKRWAGWLAHTRLYALESLSPDHTEQLIHRYYASQIGSNLPVDQAEHILEFSKGLPLAVTTAVRLWVKYGVQTFSMVEADVLHELVSQLRQGVPSEFVPILQAAAILRYFNRSILRSVIEHNDISDAFEELRQFPFVRPDVVSRQPVFRIHDRVRDFLNEALLVDDPERFQTFHKRAADFFAEELKATEVAMSEQWEHLAVEHLHHLLHANVESGLEQLHRLFGYGFDYSRYDFCHTLIKEAASLRTASRKLVHRVKYYRILLVIAESSWAFVNVSDFKELVDESNLDLETQPELLYHYGRVLKFIGRREEGKLYLEKSLDALKRTQRTETSANCLVLVELADFKSLTQKRTLLEQAIATARNLAGVHSTYYVYTSLGGLYFYANDYSNALLVWREGLAVAQQTQNLQFISDAYNRIGLGLIALSDFQNAETSLMTALEIAQRLPDLLGPRIVSINWIKRHLGILEYAQKNYSKAIEYLTESVEGKRRQKSITGRFRTEVLLAECLYLTDQMAKVQLVVEELNQLAKRAGIGDFVARWYALHGNILLDTAVESTDIGYAVNSYTQALTAGLLENAYSLDDAMSRIFWKLRLLSEKDEQAKAFSVLDAILTYWQTGEVNGIPLIDLEQQVRNDASVLSKQFKPGLVIQIQSALLSGIQSQEPLCWQGL